MLFHNFIANWDGPTVMIFFIKVRIHVFSSYGNGVWLYFASLSPGIFCCAYLKPAQKLLHQGNFYEV